MYNYATDAGLCIQYKGSLFKLSRKTVGTLLRFQDEYYPRLSPDKFWNSNS